MRNMSFTRILYAVMTMLTLWVLIMTGAGMWNASVRYLDSQRIQNLAVTVKELFSSFQMRSLRPASEEALMTLDDPTAKIEEMKSNMYKIANQILVIMDSLDIANSNDLTGPVRQSWETVERDYKLVFDEIAKPRADRRLPDAWFSSVGTFVAKTAVVTAAVSNSIRMSDPFLAEMVQVHRLATQIRSALLCVQLGNDVEAGRRLDDQLREKVEQSRGVIAAS